MFIFKWAVFDIFLKMDFGVSSGRNDDENDLIQSNRSGQSKNSIKVDPEQQQKYEDIITLLLAGGYFRARISTLDPFDKVKKYKFLK